MSQRKAASRVRPAPEQEQRVAVACRSKDTSVAPLTQCYAVPAAGLSVRMDTAATAASRILATSRGFMAPCATSDAKQLSFMAAACATCGRPPWQAPVATQ